jgi:hypothetical protein
MGDQGVDLRELHGQDHENDAALGLGRHPRRSGS